MRHDIVESLRDEVLPFLRRHKQESAELMDELLWFIAPKPMEVAPKATVPGQCSEIIAWCPDDSVVSEGDWRVVWWEPAMGVWWGDRDLEERPACWIPYPYPPPKDRNTQKVHVPVFCGVCRHEIAKDNGVWRHVSGEQKHSAEPEVAP